MELITEKLNDKILNLLKEPLLDGKRCEGKNIAVLEGGTVVGRVVCWAGLETDTADIICDIEITDQIFSDRLSKAQVNLDDISLDFK